MKAFVVVNNNKTETPTRPLGWYLLADSAVSNTGKPFYLHEYQKTEVCAAMAIKISRLGKSISPRFASRYYCEFAPALHFFLPGLAENLRERGLPEDPARNFDKALMAGDFLPYKEEWMLQIKVNGVDAVSFGSEHLKKEVGDCLQLVSEYNTLKMGDLVIPAISTPVEIKRDDILELIYNGEKAFNVRIK